MRLEVIEKTGNKVIMPGRFSLDGRRTDGTVNFSLVPSGNGFSDEVAREYGLDVLYRYTGIETGILQHLPPKDEEIGGAFVILHTQIDGRPHIFVHREKLTNPKTDKKEGDWSVPAETRESAETLEETVRRGIEQETGLDPSLVHLSRPFGCYRIHGKDAFSLETVTWVQARHGLVDYSVLKENPLKSVDQETDSHCLVHPLYLLGVMPVRAGVNNIVSHWLKGWNNIVADGSPSRRDTQVIFEYKR